LLSSAREHYVRQQRVSTAGVVAARKAWADGSGRVARVVAAFQILVARDAAAAVDAMLAEQGISDPPDGTVAVAALAGIASDGRALDTLFDQAVSSFQFGLMVATQLQDAARAAASVSIASRNRVGYVRMLNPPSCSRCVILAGKWFGWNEGFRRHPLCDCRHIPTTENVAHDLTTNPDTYFRSLSAAEQNKIFTEDGAQAIRDGADMSQVVNARSGMSTAQIGGRDALVTTTGTTRRSATGRRLGKRPRIMPETIYKIAADRADAQRLLRLYGYIL